MFPAYPQSARLKLLVLAFLPRRSCGSVGYQDLAARRSEFVERVRISIVLDNKHVDVLQFGDAMRRLRGEFLAGSEDEMLPARRQ